MRRKPSILVLMGLSALLTVCLCILANALIVDVLRASEPSLSNSTKLPRAAALGVTDPTGSVPEVTVPAVSLVVGALLFAVAALLWMHRARAVAALCFVAAATQMLFALHLRDLATESLWQVQDGSAWISTNSVLSDHARAELNVVAVALIVSVGLAVAAGVMALRASTAEPIAMSSPRASMLVR